MESLGQRLSFWGVVSGTGKPLCKTTLQRILTNKVYLGLIVHNGETYKGGFPLIVSRATFEKAQEVLKNRTKPHHSKKRYYFPFTVLFTCGECGAQLRRNGRTATAEHTAIIVVLSGLVSVHKDI